MKALLIESSSGGGHHDYYSEAVSKAADESILITPNNVPAVKSRQIILDSSFVHEKSFRGYVNWLLKIKKIVIDEKPDVIEFLYGDALYRYFGLGIKYVCSGRPCVVTCHSIRKSLLHRISMRRLAKNVSRITVHTKALADYLNKIGINNTTVINYPEFMKLHKINRSEALNKLGLNVPDDTKIILALGGTRHDKGLDILLASLKLLRYGGGQISLNNRRK